MNHRYLDCRVCKLPICVQSSIIEDHVFLANFDNYWPGDKPASVDLEDEIPPTDLKVIFERLGRNYRV